MKRLENKIALITGGTSGIGYSTAQEFMAQGAKVILTGRNRSKLDEALKLLGTGAYGIISDASDWKQITDLPAKVKEITNKLDILFMNASSDVVAPFDMQSEDAYDKTFIANTKGVYFTIQKLLPLIPAGGSIIFNGTISINLAMAGVSPLIAAKGAMVALGRSLAVELAAKGIRVNSISPGAIKTPGAISKAAKFMGLEQLAPGQFEAFESNITQSIPMKRLGESAEIAKAVLFLASDESSYVTGSDLVVDGGKSIAW
jgi:NAD(P)-dependent dehydrogenase (short-subunit alcohol dehydrogenase family)